MQSLRTFLFALALHLIGVIASTPALADAMTAAPGDPIQIQDGTVAGTRVSPALKAYLGLPFAAPPVRENRWREPQPVKPWTGIYTADAFKPECPQGLRSPGINHYFGEEAVSEDCLYLNIWAPAEAKAGDKLPVVVWIYGGAFNVGSASSPIYSGAPLASKGVIYVALNYRLGVFGFLAHPELTAESGRKASGNWGFLDQVAGLKWVQANIAAFGGDPANVTLVGQSAGAMSINNLQASPLARGLFARIYAMSGSTLAGGPADARGVALAESEQAGLKLQAAMKAEHIADLRLVSWDKVLAATQQAGVRPGPNLDGYYLSESPQTIFDAGRQSDVPVVVGSTANDIGTNPPIRSARTLADYRKAAADAYGALAPTFLKLWPARNDIEAARQAEVIGQSSGFGLGARNWAASQTRTGRQPAYLFLVTKTQPIIPGVRFSDFNPTTAGAYHMVDVPYFLGTYEAFNLFRRTRDWTGNDRAISDAMQDSIVAFARTGNPATAKVPFAPYNAKAERRTVFGEAITQEPLNTRGLDFLLQTPVQASRPAPEGRPRQTF